MRKLVQYQDYSRQEVHSIFDPESAFTPQAGTWGLHGIIPLPERSGDYIFFVTFGQRQAKHAFDEGLTPEGVLRWQSQPKQRLRDQTIRDLIHHDADESSIYLFLRTKSRRDNTLVPYTYLGRLKYVDHDHDREQPVYFTWQTLEWNLPDDVRQRMDLRFEGTAAVKQNGERTEQDRSPGGLVRVPGPMGSSPRFGVSTSTYRRRIVCDYAEQDARNRRLGLAGEHAVVENERNSLILAGRADLAERILQVASIEGDGAGYEVKSFTVEGQEKFIEVKTTRGDQETAFLLSANEARLAAEHADRYYLYRIFEFDVANQSGKFFVHTGGFSNFSLKPVLFKVRPSFDQSRQHR